MNVKWNVKEIARVQDFNAHSLALAAGLSYNTVRPIWLNKAKQAHLETMGKIARVLGVAPGDLVSFVEETAE